MADDYLARSGAKERLTQAVATLLEVRPANPVGFLAQLFDGRAISPVERSVRLLRTCPPYGSAFQNAMGQAFRWLSSHAPDMLSIPVAAEEASRETAAIPRQFYDELLAKLIAHFPLHVRHRVVDALRAKSSSSSAVVHDEFQRGVQICVLLEELFDVVDELFNSIDKGSEGEVKQAVVLSALENASQQSKQRDGTESDNRAALEILRIHLQSRHEIPNISIGGGSQTEKGDLFESARPIDDDVARGLGLTDLQEIAFLAVFTP